MNIQQRKFVPGVSALPSQGRSVPEERKSPPLAQVAPEAARLKTVTPDRHIKPEYVDLEWDKLWTKTWLCAGRVSDVETVGSWFRFDFARESFIIIRSAPDRLSALYNVCQHRGNRLVDDDFGKSGAFVCPYHSWRYSRDGVCTSVTDREFFSEAALCGSIDLRRARCETFGGFVFINMDDDAGPLLDHLGEVADFTSLYPLESHTVMADVVLELACNWKTILDAFSENYHVHITHVSQITGVDDVETQIDFFTGGHSRRITPIGSPSGRRVKTDRVSPLQEMMLAGVGVDPKTYQGTAGDVRRTIQLAKRAMGGLAGEAYRKLSDNQLSDNWATNIFPNLHLSLHAEGTLMMWYEPHRSDPDRCYLHLMTLGTEVLAMPGVYLPLATDFEATGRPRRIRVRHDDPGVRDAVGQLLWEDIRNTRETQQGLKSRGLERIRLSEHEQVLMHQYAELDRYLSA